MKGRMAVNKKSYVPPFTLNEPFTGGGVAEVVESRNPGFSLGDVVVGMLPWQTMTLLDGARVAGLTKLTLKFPASYALGVLGMPGMTAYYGLTDICAPKEGETVFVSGAAGAVGMLVGQIAKIKGCRVVGIAGSDDKLKVMKDVGFDFGINYKTEKNMADAIRAACPKGIDCYFDNVGGSISDNVLAQMNIGGRVALCGAISQYAGEEQTGPRWNALVVGKGLKIQGFIVSREYGKRFPEGIQQMATYLSEGKLKVHESILDGFENMPKAFLDMMAGGNTGKQVVKV